MNKRRLLKLAKFLDTLEPNQFEIGLTVAQAENGCGTVCCAVGWTPKIFPKFVKWQLEPGSSVPVIRMRGKKPGSGWVYVSEHLFDLDFDEAEYLFTRGKYFNVLQQGEIFVSPKMVADRIRFFVKENEETK